MFPKRRRNRVAAAIREGAPDAPPAPADLWRIGDTDLREGREWTTRNQLEQLQANYPGLTAAEYHRRALEVWGGDPTERLREILSPERTAVYINMPESTLREMLHDPRHKYKNMAETGTTLGGDMADAAERLENIEGPLFGLPRNALERPDTLPKYGSIGGRYAPDNPKLADGESPYGNIAIRLKKDVDTRTTISIGDSLNSNTGVQRTVVMPRLDIDSAAADHVLHVQTSWTREAGDRFELVPAGTLSRRSGAAADAAAARRRIMRGEGDHNDVVEAYGVAYVEAQIFGEVTLKNVDAIIVESRRQAVELRRLLDRLRVIDPDLADIKIEPAVTHTRLARIGHAPEPDLVASLNVADVDSLGEWYHDRLLRDLDRLTANTTEDFVWPDELRAFRTAHRGKSIAEYAAVDAAEKRAFLRAWYRRAAQGEKGGLPPEAWRHYDPTKVGFAVDVLDYRLLEKYPERPPSRNIFEVETAALEAVDDAKPPPISKPARVTPAEVLEHLEPDRLDAAAAAALERQILEIRAAYPEMTGLTVERARAWRREIWGGDPEAGVRQALAADRVDIHMAISDADFETAVAEGKFKNFLQKASMEPRSSALGSAAWNMQERIELEARLIGAPAGLALDPDNAPVYGFLARAGSMDFRPMASFGYGTTMLRIKKHAKWRHSTITAGDSLVERIRAPRRPFSAAALQRPGEHFVDRVLDLHRVGTTDKPDLDVSSGHISGRQSAEARARIMRGEGDYRDLLLGTEEYQHYIEVQMFGGLDIDDVEAVIVESRAQAARWRKLLDEAGYEHVPVQRSHFHSKLQLILERDEDTLLHLNVDDIDRLGEAYLDAMLRGAAADLLERNSVTYLVGFEPPTPVRLLVEKYRTAEGFRENGTLVEKRLFLREYYRMMAEGERGALPELHWRGYDASKAGWTDDVLHRDLLDRYPDAFDDLPENPDVEFPKPPKPAVGGLAEVPETPSPELATPILPRRIEADAGDVDPYVRNLDLDAAFDGSLDDFYGADVSLDVAAARHAVVDNAIIRAWGGDPTEQIRRVTGAENTAVYAYVKEADAVKIIRDDKYKNSMETERGSFKVIGSDRLMRYESEIFGVPPEAMRNPDLLPKSGFLAGAETMDWPRIVGHGYGDVLLKFKNRRVRHRSTITLNDSLDGHHPETGHLAPAAPLEAPSRRLAVAGFDLNELDDAGGGVFGSAEARRKLMRGEGDYRDLLRAVGTTYRYLEVQMFGKVDLDDLDAIIVETRRAEKRVKAALRKAGRTDIKVQYSAHHTRLKQMADGELEKYTSLSPDDIDRLGEFWLDHILLTTSIPLEEMQPWRGWKWPPSIRKWREKYKGLGQAGMLHAPLAEKRAYLRDYFERIALKEKSGMPKALWEDFRKSHAGFTAQVANVRLLEAYPGYAARQLPERPANMPVPRRTPDPADQADVLDIVKPEHMRRRHGERVFALLEHTRIPGGFGRVEEVLEELWGPRWEELGARLGEILAAERTSTYIALPPDRFLKAAQANRVRNIFETVADDDADIREELGWYLTSRKKVEAALFDIATDAEETAELLDLRPKYGFLAKRDSMDYRPMLGRYGRIQLRLKSDTRRRTTLTPTDSMEGGERGMMPTVPLAEPDDALAIYGMRFDAASAGREGRITSILPRGAGPDAARARIMRGEGSYQDILDGMGTDREYLEAQIFGRVDFDDVDAVIVETVADARLARQALDEAGYRHVPVLRSHFHQNLELIMKDPMGAYNYLNADDVRRLGEPYLDKLVGESMGVARWFDMGERGLPTRMQNAVETAFVDELRLEYGDATRFVEQASIHEKRRVLIEYLDRMSRESDTAALNEARERGGWTAGVLDRRLLERPPDPDAPLGPNERIDFDTLDDISVPVVSEEMTELAERMAASQDADLLRALETTRRLAEDADRPAISRPHSDLVEVDSVDYRDELERVWGGDPTEGLRAALMPERVGVYQQIHEDKLFEAIRDNHFKNAGETGRSSVADDAERRFRGWERRLWGLGEDAATDPGLRPIYAFLAGPDRMDHQAMTFSQYGSISVKFKKRVMRNTTVTAGDSMEFNDAESLWGPLDRRSPPTPLLDPDRRLGEGALRVNDATKDSAFRAAGGRAQEEARARIMRGEGSWRDVMNIDERMRYVEAQIFGRVTLDDVESIMVDSRAVRDRLREQLRAAGYGHIEILESPYHGRLARIMRHSWEDGASLSAADVDGLGEPYLDALLKRGVAGSPIRHGDADGWTVPGELAGILARAGAKDIDDFVRNAPLASKKAYLKKFYAFMAQGENGPLPRELWEMYEPGETGFVADVLNRSLLTRYEHTSDIPPLDGWH